MELVRTPGTQNDIAGSMNCHQVSSLQSMKPKHTNTKFKTMVCLIAPLICTQIPAGEDTHFPGAFSDRSTIKAQQLVEELYEKGEYEIGRAHV